MFSTDSTGPAPSSALCCVGAGFRGPPQGALGLAIGRHQRESRGWGFHSPISLWALTPPLTDFASLELPSQLWLSLRVLVAAPFLDPPSLGEMAFFLLLVLKRVTVPCWFP